MRSRVLRWVRFAAPFSGALPYSGTEAAVTQAASDSSGAAVFSDLMTVFSSVDALIKKNGITR